MTTDFPTWVRAEAKRRGWSQATLAKRPGLALSSVKAVISLGRRKPGMCFFAGIAAAFEMPLVEVIVIWKKQAGQCESKDPKELAGI